MAQYGQPVVASVAEELTRKFAACLASMLETEALSPAAQGVKPVGGLRLAFSASWRKLRRRA